MIRRPPRSTQWSGRRQRQMCIRDRHKRIIDNFNFNHISLAPDNEFRKEEIEQIINKEISIGTTYRNLIDNFSKIRQIMEVFAKTEKAILFHCQEGKDRTGIISMILLGLANVARADIIADYEISSAYLGYIERYDEHEPLSVFRITNPYYCLLYTSPSPRDV